MNSTGFIASAKRTIDLEIEALHTMRSKIDASFELACQLIWNCNGRVVVTGMGKSGHIGNKIAATFASTGTPSFFVHPGEASHGDLGMFTRSDVVVALSNSGETEEVLTIIPLIKRMGAKLISITSNSNSSLAQQADVSLNTGVTKEACPLGLAPSSSTTAQLALGDALAIALLEARGFTAEDFAYSHPGGSLGRKLLLKAADIMHSGADLPRVEEDALLPGVLIEVTRKRLGMTTVVNAIGELVGVFTDGDLRRIFEAEGKLSEMSVGDVMTRGGTVVTQEILAAECLAIMQQKKINALVVVDHKHRPIGALNMHDLLLAGVI